MEPTNEPFTFIFIHIFAPLGLAPPRHQATKMQQFPNCTSNTTHLRLPHRYQFKGKRMDPSAEERAQSRCVLLPIVDG